MASVLEQGFIRDSFNVTCPTSQVVGQTVDTNETTLIDVLCRGKQRVAAEISNHNGGAALTSCKVYGKVNGGDFVQLLGNADADYTTPIGPLKYCFGASNAATTPRTLAANAKVFMVLEVGGFDELKITATCGTSTTVNAYAEAS